jgi:hypothetical protein
MEPVAPKKFLGHVFWSIGQQGDPEKIFLAGEVNGVIEQFRAVTVPLELLMDDEVFQQNYEPPLGCADREKEIDHADNRAVAPENKHSSAARLFENQTQPAQLLPFVGAKIAFLREESAEHLGQLIQISLGSRLNDDVLAHRLHCLFAEIEGAGNPRIEGLRCLAAGVFTKVSEVEWIDMQRPTKLTMPLSILM